MRLAERHKQHIVLGVMFTMLSALCYSLMSLMAKIIGEDASVDTLVFTRFAVSLVLILPWVAMRPKEALFLRQPLKIVARACLTLCAFGAFFFSLRSLSLTDALLLNNTFPLFVPLILWYTRKVKTQKSVWLGIVVGFIGVIFVLHPDPQLFKPASLIGLTSGFFAAFTIVLIRSLTRTTPIVQILFYNFLLCSILTSLLLPWHWQSLTTHTLLLLLILGLFGALYQLFSTLSFAKASIRITSSLMFSCIIFGAIADYFIWNHTPTLLTLLGILCVIIGGSIVVYFGQKEVPRK